MVFQGRAVDRIYLCKFRRLFSVSRVAFLHKLLVLFPVGVDGLTEARPASFVVFGIAAVGVAKLRTPRLVFVANDYAGIEFRNYERIVTRLRQDNKRRMQAAGATEWADLYKIAWYYSVDASSGCVWDLRVVRSIEYVRRVKARGGGGIMRYLVDT